MADIQNLARAKNCIRTVQLTSLPEFFGPNIAKPDYVFMT